MYESTIAFEAEYYRHSGKFNVGKTILSTFRISLIVAILSVLYSWAMTWLPFKQLNFIITIVMWLVLFFASFFAENSGQIRNRAVSLIVGIILFLVFVYWHFVGYAAIHLHDSLIYLFSPSELIRVVSELNEAGTWVMFGVKVRGYSLTILWLIEHILLFLAVMAVFYTGGDSVYIESKKCWAEEKPLDDVIQPLPATVKASFEQKDYRAIENSCLSDKESDHCVISYFTDEEEQSEEYYLKIENVTMDEYGSNEETLIQGLKITKEDLDRIRMLIYWLHDRRDEVLNELLNDLPEGMLNELLNDLPDEQQSDLSEDCREKLKDELRNKLLHYLPDGMPVELQDDLMDQLLDYLLENRPEDISDNQPDELLDDLLNDLPDGMLDNLLNDLLDELPDDQGKDLRTELLEDLRYKVLDYLPDDLTDELQDQLLGKLLDKLIDDPPETAN